MTRRPLVAHADWSKEPRKRVMAVAAPAVSGWVVTAEAVGSLRDLLARLRRRAPGHPVVLGVDAPIGLPRAYVERRGLPRDFPAFLDGLAPDAPFYCICRTLDQVCVERPFFPDGTFAGAQLRQRWAQALGIEPGRLLRQCERAAARGRDASMLFWTLGGNQVGKAAITLWRDVLAPARAGPDRPALWPFEGAFAELLQSRPAVVVETYPAEALERLCPAALAGAQAARLGGKRRHAYRMAFAAPLVQGLENFAAVPDADTRHAIETGFGPTPAGEDAFDAMVGLLGMLATLRAPPPLPADAIVRHWEGWIFGRAVPA